MENPYVLLVGALCAATIFGSGVKIGIDWQQGQDAIAAQNDINDAVGRAKMEGKKQVENAVKAEKIRTAARLRQQKLEQELAKDELAKNCHVSVGTFGVLQQSIEAANKTIANRVDGAVQPNTKPAGFLRSGFSSVDWVLGTRSGSSMPAESKLNRLDQ